MQQASTQAMVTPNQAPAVTSSYPVSNSTLETPQMQSAFTPMPGVSPVFEPAMSAIPMVFNTMPMLSNANQHPIQHPLQVPQPLTNLPVIPMSNNPQFQRSNSQSSVASLQSMGSINSQGEPQPQFNPTQVPGYPMMAQPQLYPQMIQQPQMQPYFPTMMKFPSAESMLQPAFYCYQPMQTGFVQMPMKRSSSGSKSFDGRDGRDGSRRTSSDRVSWDGYGSDFNDNRSRRASTHGSEVMFPTGKDKDAKSPGEGSGPGTGSPDNLIPAFDSLLKPGESGESFQSQISQSIGENLQNVCNPSQQTYSVDFLMSYQNSPECTPCPHNFVPEDYTTLQFLKDKKCTNLARYISSLEETKGKMVFQRVLETPDRIEKKRPTSKERQEELFKTELCNAWINGQKCRFGKRCIFAHGQHELRAARRKIERNRQKPPLKKHIMSILNRITNENSHPLTTELLCCCVEEIRKNEKDSMVLVKSIFTKACTEQNFQSIFANMWSKLVNVHPMRKRMQRQMFELCLCEYANPKSKYFGLGCMQWIAELCRRNQFGEKIIYKILDDMHVENARTERNIEFWCKLIQCLRGCINTNKYFACLSQMKQNFGSKTRFMILELEDLKKSNWVR